MRTENQTILKESFDAQSLMKAEFSECVFENCSFKETDFRNASFSECVFKGCNLHLVKMDGCSYKDVIFEECKIVAGDFYKADLHLLLVQFKRCALIGCNFSSMKLKMTNFSESKIKDCIFTEAQLSGANFKETDLLGSIFHQTDLSNANFTNAINYSIDPKTNILRKAKFSVPEVVSLLSAFDIQIS